VDAEIWKAAILGVVQGLTEFLPVSSTGHLILVPSLLGWNEGIVRELQFDVALHIGTLGALLAVFWRDWVELIVAGLRSIRDRSLRDPQARLAWMIALGTIPAVAAGVLFQRAIESNLRSPIVVGTMMAAVGIILEIVDRTMTGQRTEESIGPGTALAIGLGQASALIPGVSRSGATIGVGLAAGLQRASAARFSFLLSTPVITGAILKEGIDVMRQGVSPSSASAYGVGILTSAVTGYIAIRWFLSYLRRRSLRPFVIYRVVAGLVVIALAASGRIS
jgi:undecaprenyl-diphosphatase